MRRGTVAATPKKETIDENLADIVTTLRPNINRFDHVAIVVRPENLESAVEEFSKLLGISFEGPFKSEISGVTYYLDWSSGMEVYAPHDPVLAADRFQYLEEHGEGVFRLIFGVADLDEAAARARSLGHEISREGSAFDLNPAWRDRFDRMDEVLLAEPLHGVRVAFSQIEPSGATDDDKVPKLRQSVNRLDHLVILVHPENLESAVEEYSKLLGISFEGPYKSDRAGITIYIDWMSGIEIYAPYDPVLAADRVQYLEEHGEGVFRLLFGVADIGEAVARARSLGYQVSFEGTAFNLKPEWRDRFHRMDETMLAESTHGVRIAFAQIEPREGVVE